MDTSSAPAPVFVLTSGRSGSTLLRVILDSHPDLACPPETGVGATCLGFARMLGVLEGLRQANPVGEGSVTLHAAMAIRRAVDAGYQDYLARHGKSRWCDKSLDNLYCADLLAQLWPEARFLCMTRHCMDVVASVIEACPWGLSGFGLGRFAAQYPGNSVAAAGAWWLAAMRAAISFENKYPGRCLRVRYEDLVTAPEPVMAGIFSFLGVRQAPGITQECFRTGHETHGPGDHKIWHTSSVTSRSVGRGNAIPARLLPDSLRADIDEVLRMLGYYPTTYGWSRPQELTDSGAAIGGTGQSGGREFPGPVRAA